MKTEQLVQELKERNSIEGIWIQDRWVWLLDQEKVTRAANQLLKTKRAEAMYFRGGKAVLHLKRL